MRGWIAVAGLSVFALGAAQQTPPVFRAGVDLITIDVAVFDSDGKPVTGLAAADFSIVAAKQPRRVLSADYVSAARARLSSAVSRSTAVPAPSTNAILPGGRTFLFAIDVEQIPQGGGRVAIDSIANYLDRLAPDDRAGFIALPYGVPSVDVTTNRSFVKEGLRKVIGGATRNQSALMTVGEAAAIETLDQGALNEYLDRINARCRDSLPELFGLDDDPNVPCADRFQRAATKVMDVERRHARDLFFMLRQLADGMAPIDGPKSLILVSQGVVNDRATLDEFRTFAQAAERARLTVYALNLDAPLSDVTGAYNLTGSHVRDHRVLLDGMATLAIAGRGDTFVISGTPDRALEQIDAETSGYYLLSFERRPDDRGHQQIGIDVSVNWPNAKVRARRDFTPETTRTRPPAQVPADTNAAINELLRWPVPASDIGMDLDTYTGPAPTCAADLRTILAASLVSGDRRVVAAGYEVMSDRGGRVAQGFEPVSSSSASVPLRRLEDGLQLYVTGFAVPPGRYRAKFAAIDDAGRRGSVEHTFEVRSGRIGPLRMSDLVIGELSSSGFVGRPALGAKADALPVQIELCGDSAAAFADASITLELAHAGAAPFARSRLSLAEGDDPRRRLANATLAIASLPPGEYVVTANLLTATGAELRASRAFTRR